MKKFIDLIVIFLIAFTPIDFLNSAEPSAKAIITKTDDLMRGRTNYGVYEMKIFTPRWKRTIKMEIWVKGKDKTFIEITYPAKDAGTKFLKLGYEMWNYIPKVERTIKIPPSMMMQSWMGSDFTNDDLVKESSIVDDYTHSLIGKEQIQGFPAYKIQLDPKPDAPVVWGKIILWVRIKDYVPLKQEFYNEKGELIHILNFSEIKWIGDRSIPTLWEMTPLKKKGRKTVIKIEKIKFNIPINDSLFSLRTLKRGSREKR
jgi:outer membrane lipoprotein-sorting protein